ncbi:MAG: hypothetical protein Q8R48_03500, partial [Candidatus Omnitrophota bacterium]|nr:hypothetical protein [Candidatus Omnitrophota bacterium]
MQTIPLRLEHGWNYTREAVDWDKIGDLGEVVFVVSPMDAGEKSNGILYFYLDFYKLTFLEKYFTLVKVGVVFAISLLMALLAAFIGRLFGRNRSKGKSAALSGFKRDLLYGAAAVLIAGVGLSIYSMGTASPLDESLNFNFLIIGLLGAVIAQILKFGLTGRHLTPLEIFQNILLTGLLAASSSRRELLEGPSSWLQVLMFSNIISTIAFLIYHISNARSLAVSGKHLRAITGALIVGTPYLFNWLLLVENTSLMQELANIVTAGSLAAWPAIPAVIGRFIVVFIFNEAVANGIGLLTRERYLRTLKAHLVVLLVSLGVVVSPMIADAGSTKAVASLPAAIRAIVCILTTMFSFGGLWGEVYLITGMMLDAGRIIAPSSETILKHVNSGTKKGMAYSAIFMAILYGLSMLIYAPSSKKIMAAAPMVVGILSGALIFPLVKTILESFDGSLP